MKIGFIGLGYMGSRMAMNLVKNQYELIIFNRTKDKAQDLEKEGAKLAESPPNLAREVASSKQLKFCSKGPISGISKITLSVSISFIIGSIFL